MTFFGLFVNLLFLGQAFTLMLVYVWSRRNPIVRMNFIGVMNFQVSISNKIGEASVIAFKKCSGSILTVGIVVLFYDIGKYRLGGYHWNGCGSYLLFS